MAKLAAATLALAIIGAVLFLGRLPQTPSTAPTTAVLPWLCAQKETEIEQKSAEATTADLPGLLQTLDDAVRGRECGPLSMRGAILAIGSMGPRASSALPRLLRLRHELQANAAWREYVIPSWMAYTPGTDVEALIDQVRVEAGIRSPYWPRVIHLRGHGTFPNAWGLSKTVHPFAAMNPGSPRLTSLWTLNEWAIKRVVDPGTADWWAEQGSTAKYTGEEPGTQASLK